MQRSADGAFESGNSAQIARIAEEDGLDATAARAAIEQGQFAEAIRQDISHAAAYGIRGVPFYVIDGKHGISGDQPAELVVQALTQAASDHPEQVG